MTMKTYKTLARLLPAFFVAVAFLISLYLFSSYRNMPVNEDAGCYVPTAKEVLRGATPTVEVSTSYMPGMFYATAFWMKLFGTGYDNVVLLIYLVNVANCILLYLLISHFIRDRLPKFLISLSYYYSSFLLEGFYVEMEPLEVFFILAAYLIYIGNRRKPLKDAVTGLFLGCSIMIKQYSLAMLAGFLVAVWMDEGRKAGAKAAIWRTAVMSAFSLVPLLVFLTTTGAKPMDALYSFGFLGRNAISYALFGWREWAAVVRDIVRGTVLMNWLFAPLAAYCIVVWKKKDFLGDSGQSVSIICLFFFSCLPLFVRQFGHYFQLIAPWSYLLLGILSVRPIAKIKESDGNSTFITAAAVVCLIVVLPLFLAFTPSFFTLKKPGIAFFTALFIIFILIVLSAGLRLSKYRLGASAVIAGLCAVIFFETLFLSLKYPFREMGELKRAQLEEARGLNKIFSRGSTVLVSDYPQIYVTGDFVSPLHDYEFNTAERLKDTDWKEIDNIIMGRDRARALRVELNRLGYREIMDHSSARVALFRKDLPVH